MCVVFEWQYVHACLLISESPLPHQSQRYLSKARPDVSFPRPNHEEFLRQQVCLESSDVAELKPTVLLLAANEYEFHAVCDVLHPIDNEKKCCGFCVTKRPQYPFYIGLLRDSNGVFHPVLLGKPLNQASVRQGAGQCVNAALFAWPCIKLVIAVGIGYGTPLHCVPNHVKALHRAEVERVHKKLRIGDVLVSSEVWDYSYARITGDSQIYEPKMAPIRINQLALDAIRKAMVEWPDYDRRRYIDETQVEETACSKKRPRRRILRYATIEQHSHRLDELPALHLRGDVTSGTCGDWRRDGGARHRQCLWFVWRSLRHYQGDFWLGRRQQGETVPADCCVHCGAFHASLNPSSVWATRILTPLKERQSNPSSISETRTCTDFF